MRAGLVAAALADVLAGLGIAMLLPVLAALIMDPYDMLVFGAPLPRTALAFLLASAVTGATAMALGWLAQGVDQSKSSDQDTAAAIALGWLAVALFAAIPFLLVLGPLDAWFEAMAATTATRTSTLHRAQAPGSLMFYRALLQWLAGLAIITIAVAIISRITHGGSQLLAADITGSGRTRARLAHTGRNILPVYGAITLALFVAYLGTMRFTGARLPWSEAIFDALVIAWGTVSTGGFSHRPESLAHYQSTAVELLALLGMVAAGTSYPLWHRARRARKHLWLDPEWRRYMQFILAGGALITVFLFAFPASRDEAFHAGFFTIISVGTTTGFEVTDGSAWPALARAVLIVALFTGAMVGSASGGVKILRVSVLLRVAAREVRRLLHPRAVIPIKQRHQALDESVIFTVIAFFFAYTTTWLVGTGLLMVSSPGLPMYEGGMAAASALANLGQDSSVLGTDTGFEHESAPGRAILSLLMWAGRVEIFAALLLLSPDTWRRFPRK